MGFLQSLYDELIKDKVESLSEEELRNFDETIISELIPEFIDESSILMDKALMDTLNEHVEEKYSLTDEFNSMIEKQWGSAFRMSIALTTISIESVETFFNDNSESGFVDEAKIYCLQRLHARACRLSEEILCLLRSGYPDAGLARWRTLYEVAVISTFLLVNDNGISERYLDHMTIDSFKEMKLYNKHSSKLGTEGHSKEAMNEMKNKCKKLRNKYGIEFDEQYGWTSSVIPIKRERNFYGIEKRVSFNHLRPYYKWACNKTHAGAKGNEDHLGLMKGHNAILIGASNYGFTDVAHCTAIALNIVTVNVLTYKPNMDSLVAAKVLKYFVDKIGNEYLRIQKSIKEGFNEDGHN